MQKVGAVWRKLTRTRSSSREHDASPQPEHCHFVLDEESEIQLVYHSGAEKEDRQAQFQLTLDLIALLDHKFSSLYIFKAAADEHEGVKILSVNIDLTDIVGAEFPSLTENPPKSSYQSYQT